MNHTQRHLIKEAYQEGYYQALEENLAKRFGKYVGKKLGGLLKNLFKGKKVDDVGTGEILNKIDDAADTVYVQSQPPEFDVDNLEGEIPDLSDLMKDKYGVDQFGNIDPDVANKAIRGNEDMIKKRLEKDLRAALKQERLQDYADDLGIDINDIPPDIVDDITDGLDDIDLDGFFDKFLGDG